MFVRVHLKGRIDGVVGDHVDFERGDSYSLTDQGDIDIYNGNDVIGTVSSEVWMYAEKVYGDGGEVHVPAVSPEEARDYAEHLVEDPSQIRIENLGIPKN